MNPLKDLPMLNRWSCLPKAFAMAIGIHWEFLIEMIGHDGSEIIWSELPEPYRRRSFHIQEITDALFKLKYSVTTIDAELITMPAKEGVEPFIIKDKGRMGRYLYSGNTGVLVGKTITGNRHAVYWNGIMIHDPNGTEYGLDLFRIDTFYITKTFA